MKSSAAVFGVNTYSYIFDASAADTVARLADQGYGGVELMFFKAHSTLHGVVFAIFGPGSALAGRA